MHLLKLGILIGLCAGCAHDYTDIASSESRDTSPSSADVGQLSTDEATFAFDLYRAQVGADTSSNVFFSPYSISVALAMTYAGAGGNTATQIASAMQSSLPADRLHTAFDAVDLQLESRQGIQLNIANSIWAQRTLAFGKPFLDTLAVDYGSEVRGVDFIGASTQATAAIDGWVADQTAGKIQNLFAPGSLDSTTRVVLVNAVYFDANWKTQFDSSKTTSSPFTKLDGSNVSASMMNNAKLNAPVAIAPTYTAIDLPYAGAQTSMLVIVPTGMQFASVDAALGGDFLKQVVASLQPQDVALSLPKFTLKGASVSLKSALKTMGMIDAFDPAKADLTGMVPSDQLHVDDVVHQAFVKVDESGTEAAAATGVSTGINAVEEPLAVNVNRPFFFVLRDIPTGMVLFVGRVLDPTL
ncbi:MAG TPA: serpin family protein [Polyangiaceae bacterium]|nr:serpin family protein [Polyangiaceae bacterium]